MELNMYKDAVDDSDMSLAATRSGTHLVGHGTVTQENNLQG